MTDAMLDEMERISDYVIHFEDRSDRLLWRAADQFRRVWDVKAPSFDGMFRQASYLALNLFDTPRSRPFAGLHNLIANGEGDLVRSWLGDLLRTGRSIAGLQYYDCNVFIKNINWKIDDLQMGEIYHQSLASALNLLALWSPATVYAYSPKADRYWARRSGMNIFPEGDGRFLESHTALCDSLKQLLFYQMEDCDGIWESLWTYGFDDNLNLLVYDMMRTLAR